MSIVHAKFKTIELKLGMFEFLTLERVCSKTYKPNITYDHILNFLAFQENFISRTCKHNFGD